MIQYSTTHRNDSMTDISTLAGAGAYLIIYTGSAPANCATGASGTEIVALPLSNPLGSVSGGVLTLGSITSGNAASAGTAGYWRICTDDTGATVVCQGTCGVSGADLNFPNGATFSLGETISITGFTITANGA